MSGTNPFTKLHAAFSMTTIRLTSKSLPPKMTTVCLTKGLKPSPARSECLIDDELGDKMDEYGYSGLDQVLEDEKDTKVSGDKDALGSEDEENQDDGLECSIRITQAQ